MGKQRLMFLRPHGSCVLRALAGVPSMHDGLQRQNHVCRRIAMPAKKKAAIPKASKNPNPQADATASAIMEETGTATPQAEAKPKAKKKASVPKPKKLSALDAAAKVLIEAGQPMNTREMIDAMAAQGYWTSPGGATPWATLYAAIAREISSKDKDTRFVKLGRGKFSLNA
jgi:hypothetical protein